MNVERSISRKYEELVERINSATSNLSYLNLGYWDGNVIVEDACQELVNHFTLFSEITDTDYILDVGVGYGQQLIYLLDRFPNLTIDGIDLLKSQIDLARKKTFNYLVLNRLKLEVGNAVNLEAFNNQYDKVIAIESAFHFNTRERFFKEAYAILKVGGKLALADILFSKSLINRRIEQKIGVPVENAYDITEYVRLMKKVGFRDIKMKDISDYVLPFSAIETAQNKGWRTNKTLNLPVDLNKSTLNKRFLEATAMEHYFFISGIK